MNNIDYIKMQHKIMGMAEEVKGLDIKGCLDAIYICEATAPIVDPTLYMRGMDALDKIKKTAQALRRFQKEVE